MDNYQALCVQLFEAQLERALLQDKILKIEQQLLALVNQRPKPTEETAE